MAHVCVIGAGAIGGVLAATTHEGGHEVDLALRTPFDTLTLRRGAAAPGQAPTA